MLVDAGGAQQARLVPPIVLLRFKQLRIRGRESLATQQREPHHKRENLTAWENLTTRMSVTTQERASPRGLSDFGENRLTLLEGRGGGAVRKRRDPRFEPPT